MSDIAIKVEGVAKKYQIGQNKNSSFRESLMQKLSFFSSSERKQTNDFWALQDVSFEIKQGQAVGIIGKNGAGKSTLLKILSRITQPTRGRIEINGRIASLLEVGTGFHPELSGRENVYLNGTILGMTRKEIKAKFDEIIDFSGVEKFIDTPVKYYSSGMYVRLAFAVAAHLDPEILIIDEVLAVGDAEFQKKCLGKMSEVAGQGRTVIFVSHQMDAVLRLCQHAILLEKGRTICADVTDKVVNQYLKAYHKTASIKQWKQNEAPGNAIVRLIEVRVHTEEGKVTENFDITKPIGITMEYEVLKDGDVFTHSCALFNEQRVNIFNSHDVVSEIRNFPRTKGLYSSTVWIPGNLLSEGTILAGVAIIKINPFNIYFFETEAVAFNVVDYIKGNSARGTYTLGFPGMVRPLLDWNTHQKSVITI